MTDILTPPTPIVDKPVAVYYLHGKQLKWRILFDDRTLSDAVGFLNTLNGTPRPGIAVDRDGEVVATTDHPSASSLYGTVMSS